MSLTVTFSIFPAYSMSALIWTRWGHPDILRRTSLQTCYCVCTCSSLRLHTHHEQLPLDRWAVQVNILIYPSI